MALEKSTLIFKELETVSGTVKEMAAELQPAIDALDEKKKEKTDLTNRLRSSILQETADIFQGSFLDDKVSTYHDRELIILNEATAVRQIIEAADAYFLKTGVDMAGSWLRLNLGNVKERIISEPDKFGLQPLTSAEGVTNHYSNGMEVKAVKKVKVSRDVG